jgi:hypothetical protein
MNLLKAVLSTPGELPFLINYRIIPGVFFIRPFVAPRVGFFALRVEIIQTHKR